MSKEIDIYSVRLEKSSKSKRKEIRNKKSAGKNKEAKKAWVEDKNRPDKVRKRVKNYLDNILQCASEIYPKEKNNLEEIFSYSNEKVNEEIIRYEGISSEKRKKEFNPVVFFKERFSVKEKSVDPTERAYKTLGIYRWFFLLNRAHKKDLNGFFHVDEFGKTTLDKIISDVRQERGLKRK